MGFRAVDHSINVIAYEKDNINYAMCCAWSMMADYDKLLCLLGSQSVTGKNIKKGDIIGFSSLSLEQKNLLKIGDGHSNEMNKLENVNYYKDENAILINNSKTQLVCLVIDVLHLEGIEADNLVYLKIVKSKETEGKFLHMSDIE